MWIMLSLADAVVGVVAYWVAQPDASERPGYWATVSVVAVTMESMDRDLTVESGRTGTAEARPTNTRIPTSTPRPTLPSCQATQVPEAIEDAGDAASTREARATMSAQRTETARDREEPTDEPSGDCDPSYPDDCIPPMPPALDCGDIPLHNIRVEGRDPHALDGNDNDEWGCEN